MLQCLRQSAPLRESRVTIRDGSQKNGKRVYLETGRFWNKIARVQAGKQISWKAQTNINPLQYLSETDSKKKVYKTELLWCDISLLQVSKGAKSWTLVLRGSWPHWPPTSRWNEQFLSIVQFFNRWRRANDSIWVVDTCVLKKPRMPNSKWLISKWLFFWQSERSRLYNTLQKT